MNRAPMMAISQQRGHLATVLDPTSRSGERQETRHQASRLEDQEALLDELSSKFEPAGKSLERESGLK